MSRPELSTHPLTVLRLRGSQVEMGTQHGRLLSELGGFERVVSFYPTMASRMVTQTLPHAVRPAAQAFARVVIQRATRIMHDHRRRLFPSYAARTEAMLRAANHAAELAPTLMVMELLQNSVGFLGKLGVVQGTPFQMAAIPACSSLAVWGQASRDGSLRHARNFDFPGASVWDAAPTVVFCTPDRGLRYGFVTTRGADVPGVTAFNEAGLTLTAHSRFHQKVKLGAASVIDLGHEIARTARTLADAERIARAHPVASTWGVLVSSAAEQSALLLEMNADAVTAHRPEDGAAHLTCTNHYLCESLRGQEVQPSRAFRANTVGRYDRIEERVREAVEGLDATDLERLLGDLGTGSGVRLTGDCVVSPIAVQSIVSEPDARVIRVSVGTVPTGFGPYVEVPWCWEGPASERCGVPTEAGKAFDGRGRALSDQTRDAVRAYAEVARLHVEGASPRSVLAMCEALVLREPEEPHFAAVAAYAALATDNLPRAEELLSRALRHEHGTYRRGRLLLQHGRVLHALGRKREAARATQALCALVSDELAPEQEAARKEQKRPLSRARLARATPDFILADVAIPGVHV